jgi:hypothetical protein
LSASKLDPFKDEIHRLLREDPRLPEQRVRELIEPLGYAGRRRSLTTICASCGRRSVCRRGSFSGPSSRSPTSTAQKSSTSTSIPSRSPDRARHPQGVLGPAGWRDPDIIHWMGAQQQHAFQTLGLDFASLWRTAVAGD